MLQLPSSYFSVQGNVPTLNPQLETQFIDGGVKSDP